MKLQAVQKPKKEDWVKEAREIAQFKAEVFFDDLIKTAQEENVEPYWMVEEALKYLHILKKDVE